MATPIRVSDHSTSLPARLKKESVAAAGVSVLLSNLQRRLLTQIAASVCYLKNNSSEWLIAFNSPISQRLFSNFIKLPGNILFQTDCKTLQN